MVNSQGGWCRSGEVADVVKDGYDPSKAGEVKDWYLLVELHLKKKHY